MGFNNVKFQKKPFLILEELCEFGNMRSGATPWMKMKDRIEDGEKDIERALIRVLCFFMEKPHMFTVKELDRTVLTLLSIENLCSTGKYIFKHYAIDQVFLDASFLNEDQRVQLHSRILQGVLYHKIKLPKSYWVKQVERNPQKFGVQSLAGVRQAEGTDSALSILEKLDLYESDLIPKVYSEVRGWISVDGSGFTVENFEEMWNQMKNKFNIKYKGEGE